MIVTENLQPQIVEKVVRKNGGLYRVRASLTEIGGKFYGQILSIEKIQELSGARTTVSNAKSCALCLTGSVCDYADNFISDARETITSPYFSFDFFTSQMTRAPSGSF